MADVVLPDWDPGFAFTFTCHGGLIGPVREDATHVHGAAWHAARLAGGTAAVWRRDGERLERVAEYR